MSRAQSYTPTPRELLLIASAHLEAARNALDGAALLSDGTGAATALPIAAVAVAVHTLDALDVHCADLSAILALPVA